MQVLLVEDESRVAEFVARGLMEEGHSVAVASTGEGALERAHATTYDVIVLDIGLPARDGFDVATSLRREGCATPILMLTARDAAADIVRGLDAGADDYLTKPFEFAELLARLRALERRAPHGAATMLRGGDVTLNRVSRDANRARTPLRLTPIEFRLLEVLMIEAGVVITRPQLLQRVWGMSFDPGTGLIDVHIANLRQKLEERGGSRVIITEKGVGFRFAPEES